MPEVYRKPPAGWSLPGRGYLLFFLAMPLLPALLFALALGDASRLLAYGGSFALLMAGAWVTRAGLLAEGEFIRRRLPSAPRTPRKLLGALLTGAGVFVCSWLAAFNSMTFAAVVGALALGAHLLAYGRDPVAAGTNLGGHGFSTEEIVAALREAEARIAAIDNARRDIRNPELSSRLKRITTRAREILDVIAEDPAALRRARKFLNTYLDGAKSVTEGYARTHHRDQGAELEANFRNVLSTIEEVFDEQHQKLIDDDVMDLDVQIEVLATQLEREGVV